MKQKQFEEALKRMRKLELSERLIKDFSMEVKKLYTSYFSVSGNGSIFTMSRLSKEHEELVKEWENLTGNMVYHVIYNSLEIGEMLSFLFVSKYPEEWKDDMLLLDEECTCAYVKNLTYDDFSEYGGIGIQKLCGGLVRTY